MQLNSASKRENARALALIAGISEQDAADKLNKNILITCDETDIESVKVREFLVLILERTLNCEIVVNDHIDFSAEIVIGKISARTEFPKIYFSINNDVFWISEAVVEFSSVTKSPHALQILLACCYLSAAAIKVVVGTGMEGLPCPMGKYKFDDFFDPQVDLMQEFQLGEAYLAGAGAIGNGFILAATLVDFHGKLHIVDDDFVSEGNLQRQILFDEEDIGHSKAVKLCEKAQPKMQHLELLPSETKLAGHLNRLKGGNWLECLIVAVDSRLVRRQLQAELPEKVFDASTTGSREVVLHSNVQPSEDACLSCVYYRNEQEISHEQAVAEQLGITTDEMHLGSVDKRIAEKICQRHPHLVAEKIEGLAFDSLYKALCSSQKLLTSDGKQVIAPFAFVSVLAGVLLVLSIINKKGEKFSAHNDWKVSPWSRPVPEMRRKFKKRDDCECCSDPYIQAEYQRRSA